MSRYECNYCGELFNDVFERTEHILTCEVTHPDSRLSYKKKLAIAVEVLNKINLNTCTCGTDNPQIAGRALVKIGEGK